MDKDARSIAGGAIAFALIDVLVQRGVLSRHDGLAILTEAQRICIDQSANDAARLVSGLYTKLLSANL